MTDQPSEPTGPVATPDLSGVAEMGTPSGQGPHVIVKHNVVGRYLQNSVVPADHFGDDAALQRLIDLGAVAPYDAKDANTPRLPTLSEALRNESPPTLPILAGVDTTPEEVRHVVDMSDTFAGGPLSEEVRQPPDQQVDQAAQRRSTRKSPEEV